LVGRSGNTRVAARVDCEEKHQWVFKLLHLQWTLGLDCWKSAREFTAVVKAKAVYTLLILAGVVAGVDGRTRATSYCRLPGRLAVRVSLKT
jgi:hypothetical protein